MKFEDLIYLRNTVIRKPRRQDSDKSMVDTKGKSKRVRARAPSVDGFIEWTTKVFDGISEALDGYCEDWEGKVHFGQLYKKGCSVNEAIKEGLLLIDSENSGESYDEPETRIGEWRRKVSELLPGVFDDMKPSESFDLFVSNPVPSMVVEAIQEGEAGVDISELLLALEDDDDDEGDQRVVMEVKQAPKRKEPAKATKGFRRVEQMDPKDFLSEDLIPPSSSKVVEPPKEYCPVPDTSAPAVTEVTKKVIEEIDREGDNARLPDDPMFLDSDILGAALESGGVGRSSQTAAGKALSSLPMTGGKQ